MCCPTSSLTLSVNSVYCIWLEFWAPQVCFTFLSLNDTVISRDTLAPYHFVCYFRGNFYIYTLIDFVVCVLRVMCYFKQSSPTVNNLMWMSLIISHRFLSGMAGSRGKHIRDLARYSYTHMEMDYPALLPVCGICLIPTALQWRALLNSWNLGFIF